MEVARVWGERPTVVLNEWSPQDRELAAAKLLQDRNVCPGCHHPKSMVWVEDPDFDVIAEEAKCVVCEALDSERSGTKTEKGLHYYPVIRPHPKG